jgi:hypothetical protein
MKRTYAALFPLVIIVAPTRAQAPAPETHQAFALTVSPANARVAGAAVRVPVPAPATAGAVSAAAPPALMPGWPKVIGANPNFAPARGAVFADLDRNGMHG